MNMKKLFPKVLLCDEIPINTSDICLTGLSEKVVLYISNSDQPRMLRSLCAKWRNTTIA